VRNRKALQVERNGYIKEILAARPHYQTPPDYVREKPRRKLYIPLKECVESRVLIANVCVCLFLSVAGAGD